MADTNAPVENGQGGTTTPHWTDSIGDTELKGWAQNKGFKELSDALVSYRGLEKLVGVERAGRTVAMPAKWDDAAEVNAFYDRLGRPKEPSGYKMPEKDVDPKLVEWARGTFYDAGLTDRQAEKVLAKWQEMIGGRAAEAQSAKAAAVEQDKTALLKEWGAAHDENIMAGRRAAQAFGFDAGTLNKLEDALGYGGLLKFMSDLGNRVGEARTINGDGKTPGGPLTPDAARARIAELKNDRGFADRYIKGDIEARTEMERLHRYLVGER
jgi:hypothetical protein